MRTRSISGTPRPTLRRTAAAATVAWAAAAVAGPGAQADEPSRQTTSYLGTHVAIEQAPWAASLTPLDARFKPRPRDAKRGYASICSAAVIGPRTVLTASHCVDDLDMAHMGVRVGTDNLLTTPGRVVRVARAWSVTLRTELLIGHDTAVVETQEPLGVPALPLATAAPQAGDTVSSFGFGDDRAVTTGEDVPRPLLRRLDSVVSAECLVAGDPDAFCTTTTNGSGVRPGDSGGPLVVWDGGAPALVGDASATHDAGTVNVYANAVARRDFIASPPASALVPQLVEPVAIAGRIGPGRRVSCTGRVAPRPKALEYSWRIGSLSVGPRKFVIDPQTGKRIYYRDARPPFSHRRSIRIPRNAGGKAIGCFIQARSGPDFATHFPSVTSRIPPRRRATARSAPGR